MTPGPRRITVPRSLTRSLGQWDRGRSTWLATLAERVAACEAAFGVRAGRPYPGSQCAWVAPVSEDAVLKITWPHPEAEHEPDALEAWDGHGAIRVLARLREHDAMLIERCVPGERLRLQDPQTIWDVSVAVLRQMWSHSPPERSPIRTLRDELHRRAGRMRECPPPMDPGLASEAATYFEELSDSPAGEGVVHGDFHPDNVLSATREPWLVIDPKPMLGDVAFDTAQWLLNLGDALDGDAVKRFADALGLERERVFGYVWARMVEEVLWSLDTGSEWWARRNQARARRFARQRP